VGDFLSHEDLLELESERVEHFEKVAAAEKDADKKKIDTDYVPIDFAAYSIPDKSAELEQADKDKKLDSKI
jgi:hypothetical protein